MSRNRVFPEPCPSRFSVSEKVAACDIKWARLTTHAHAGDTFGELRPTMGRIEKMAGQGL